MFRLCCSLALALALFSPLSAGELWPWPFVQTKKEVGVEFKERVVDPPNTAPRIWTRIRVNVVFENPEAQLIQVTEDCVYLAVAGRKDPIRWAKTALTLEDAVYVQNIEIELAKLIHEPGADQLQAVTAADARNVVSPNAALRKERTWRDKTGTKEIRGAYVGYEKLAIKIKTKDGDEIKVGVNALSAADKAFALELIKEDRAKEKPAAKKK